MRLGDADREELFQQLSAHAAAGRLTPEQLEHRLSAVAAAETFEHAAQVMADLPPLAAGTTARRPGRGGHGEAGEPEPGWRATSERFRDPGSGRIMRVWLDGAGGRHYVREP